ncbi:MAG: hypothetical protein M1457_05855 [bacterium]|nr:hypothetical protein [bacterium]
MELPDLNYTFTQKPLVVGGMAMEYHGLRKSGRDVDLVAPAEDIAALTQLYPERVKNLWGDLGVCPGDYEIWKTICLLDYKTLRQGAIELDHVLVISLEKLLLMKALAMANEKYLNDTKLVVKRILEVQYQSYDKVSAENEEILRRVPNIVFIEKRGPGT